MFWNRVEHHLGEELLEGFWMSDPQVRAAINQAVSGSPHKWPTDWFRETFAPYLPLERAVVIGCGTGSFERDLIKKGIARRALGVDMAAGPLEYARQAAREAGLGAQVDYLQQDAWEFLEALDQPVPGIFFHASLHHFDRLGELMGRLRRALGETGLLYLDEYVGPSMSQRTWWSLLLPNLVFYSLPHRVRRTRLVRKPINPEDPTEAICAGEILGAVAESFEILEQRDYGGNLVSLIYPNLARPGKSPGSPSVDQLAAAVGNLLRWERRLIDGGWQRSHHTVLVARPL